jgi:outer membrane protein assembly factor BamD (BamD/ComL family)
VRDELASLDRARAALSAGDAPQALALLDAHNARFPHGAMAPEATMLRIEALVAAGDRASAQRAADAFIAQSPDSPYVSRVRSLLGGAK